MAPEFWVTLAAVFVAGGAVGSAGTMLARWLLAKVDGDDPPRRTLESAEMAVMRGDVHDLSVHVHDLEARLGFQERLLGGSLTPAAPPEPMRRRLGDEEAEGDADPKSEPEG